MASDVRRESRVSAQGPLDDADTQLDDTTMTEIDQDGGESPTQSNDGSDGGSGKKGAKDQNRPKRKKARRACFACQRAHLTCGDERPCLRCVKRGLADHCQDGVRKKAKYLQDVPQEELTSGAIGGIKSTPGALSRGRTNSGVSPLAQGSQYFPSQTPTGEFSQLHQESMIARSQSGQPDTSMAEVIDPSIRSSFSAEPQRLGSMAAPPPPQQESSHGNQNHLGTMPFDPSDPALFNFDFNSLEFGSRFGAMEFGMLGHMSANAFDSTDDSGLMGAMGDNGQMNYDQSPGFSSNTPGYSFNAGNGAFSAWPKNHSSLARHGSSSHNFGNQGNDAYPGAFAIGEGGPASVSTASPGASGLDLGAYTNSPVNTSHPFPHRRSQPEFAPSTNAATNPFATTRGPDAERRRRVRDSSAIYQSVTEPYSYTTGFHLLTAFVAKRFSKDKVLRIAKALASIRPSFISCTRELSRDDLIFMEKGFQRNLILYDDFINAYGCPTLICRRTGEIVAASKEFTILTSWRRDVLLGKEANLNINHGGSSGDNTAGNSTGNSTRGAATPVRPAQSGDAANAGGAAFEAGKPQPVFLAELLDDETAVQFYDDFAKMAFGDSRGHVARRGKLLKYKTKNDPGWSTGVPSAAANAANSDIEDHAVDNEAFKMQNGRNGAATGEVGKSVGKFGSGIDVLGEKDGKVDVMICHCVKRDTFDIPMMVIMNFLPIIP